MTTAEFESVVHEHQSMVYSIARHFFRNDALAEEVSQEVFMQLFQDHRNIETGTHCVAWLRRSTIHRCIDTARRASFKREIQVEQLPDVPVDAPETDPLLQEVLTRIIASLPEKSRAVLVLRFGEDMNVDEI